jgi:hypothetical protein
MNNFLRPQEQLKMDEFRSRWEAKGYTVKFTNDGAARDQGVGSAYDNRHQEALSADEKKALRDKYTKTMKANPALVKSLVKNDILNPEAVADPSKLSRYEVDMLTLGGDRTEQLPPKQAAEWLKQLRNERAKQGWLGKKWLLPCTK